MHWERIRAHWEELVDDACDRFIVIASEDIRSLDGDHTLFVALVCRRTGMTKEAATLAIATWAEDFSEIDFEPLEEASRHAGRDDVHEQRESDQPCEGLLHWPPHVGTLHRHGGSDEKSR